MASLDSRWSCLLLLVDVIYLPSFYGIKLILLSLFVSNGLWWNCLPDHGKLIPSDLLLYGLRARALVEELLPHCRYCGSIPSFYDVPTSQDARKQVQSPEGRNIYFVGMRRSYSFLLFRELN